jgi:hypothetical protein
MSSRDDVVDDGDLEHILPWYSGKALVTVRDRTLPVLREARRIGCWPAGASRGVKAALNKQAPAIRWARDHEVDLACVRTWTPGRDPVDPAPAIGAPARPRVEGDASGTRIAHALRFGAFAMAPEVAALAARLRPFAEGRVELVDFAARWAADFAPIAALVDLLDSRRPRRTIVMGTLSPTVLRDVGTAMGVDISSVSSPPVEYEWAEVEIRGRRVRLCVGRILWPAGTRHGLSRWSSGDQCHACGHAIRSATNWVPIVADASHPGRGPGPASLWVGRDCARKLFGCDVSGEAIYRDRARPGDGQPDRPADLP